MQKRIVVYIVLFLTVLNLQAQNPFRHFSEAMDLRYGKDQPIIHYTISIDTADLSSVYIEMEIQNAADTILLAMVRHPEYDDQYWKYVEDLKASSLNVIPKLVRYDSAAWRVIGTGGKISIRYRLHLPGIVEGDRGAWRPFLSASGGLIGGVHCFFYIVGSTLAPVQLRLKVPGNWSIATGLTSTVDPFTFFAPTTAALVDAPILVGKLHHWPFKIDGIPHRVMYWTPKQSLSFDTTKFVEDIQKLVGQANTLFGRLPYRDYSFLIQDNAYGALEHANSVTLGAPASQLQSDMNEYLYEIAHEYFHSWNLVRIRPVEYGDVSYKAGRLSKNLWFSEGLTMYYADLLLRRAGIAQPDSSRTDHLARMIRRYYSNTGNMKISPELVSMAEYGPEGMIREYRLSAHLLGEILGIMLDIMIRDASDGKRNMDDLMRLMMERFSGERGFGSLDIEKAVKDIAGINVHSFFDNHVRGSKELDINYYLGKIGLRATIEWKQALENDGRPSPDLRIYSFKKDGEAQLQVGITDATGYWGKAGLHRGDKIISINGNPVKDDGEFFRIMRMVKVGDKMTMEVEQAGKLRTFNLTIPGLQRQVVTINPLKKVGEKQSRLYAQWSSNK